MKADKKNILNLLFDVSFLFLMLFTEVFQVYDVAKAEGLGIFFEMLLGGNRNTYVYLLVVFDALIMVLSALIPLIILKRLSVKNMTRLLLIIFAFVPLIDYANAVHLFDESIFGITSAPIIFIVAFKTAFSVFAPGCVVLYGISKSLGKAWNSKIPVFVILASVILMAASVFMDPIAAVFAIILYLLLSIYLFVLNDACAELNKNYNGYCRIVFVLLFLIGLYVRIEKTSHF